MGPLTAPLLGFLFLRGHISLKNRTYCPLLRERAQLRLNARVFLLG
jgi:hypothetical protein